MEPFPLSASFWVRNVHIAGFSGWLSPNPDDRSYSTNYGCSFILSPFPDAPFRLPNGGSIENITVLLSCVTSQSRLVDEEKSYLRPNTHARLVVGKEGSVYGLVGQAVLSEFQISMAAHPEAIVQLIFQDYVPDVIELRPGRIIEFTRMVVTVERNLSAPPAAVQEQIDRLRRVTGPSEGDALQRQQKD